MRWRGGAFAIAADTPHAVIIGVLLLTRLYHRHAQIAQRYTDARQRRVRDIGNGRAPNAVTATEGSLATFV